VEDVREHTGFVFDIYDDVIETPAPDDACLRLLREQVTPRVWETYPDFAVTKLGYRPNASDL
jgi:hypothetical protein